jgi:hypothetical protein
MCSLTDFIETSLGRCGGWVSTATVTGQGASLVDISVRGGDFSWPKAGTFRGHQRGLQLAITGDFFMATDSHHRYNFWGRISRSWTEFAQHHLGWRPRSKIFKLTVTTPTSYSGSAGDEC